MNTGTLNDWVLRKYLLFCSPFYIGNSRCMLPHGCIKPTFVTTTSIHFILFCWLSLNDTIDWLCCVCLQVRCVFTSPRSSFCGEIDYPRFRGAITATIISQPRCFLFDFRILQSAAKGLPWQLSTCCVSQFLAYHAAKSRHTVYVCTWACLPRGAQCFGGHYLATLTFNVEKPSLSK